METMDNVIAKEKLLDGPSNFRAWRDIVQNVFEKEDLWDLIKSKNLESEIEEDAAINIQSPVEQKSMWKQRKRAASMLKLIF